MGDTKATDEDEKVQKSCRICYQEDDLVSPCLCRGTLGYVHSSCLTLWLKKKGTGEMRCDVCRHMLQMAEKEVASGTIPSRVLYRALFMYAAVAFLKYTKYVPLLIAMTTIIVSGFISLWTPVLFCILLFVATTNLNCDHYCFDSKNPLPIIGAHEDEKRIRDVTWRKFAVFAGWLSVRNLLNIIVSSSVIFFVTQMDQQPADSAMPEAAEPEDGDANWDFFWAVLKKHWWELLTVTVSLAAAILDGKRFYIRTGIFAYLLTLQLGIAGAIIYGIKNHCAGFFEGFEFTTSSTIVDGTVAVLGVTTLGGLILHLVLHPALVHHVIYVTGHFDWHWHSFGVFRTTFSYFYILMTMWVVPLSLISHFGLGPLRLGEPVEFVVNFTTMREEITIEDVVNLPWHSAVVYATYGLGMYFVFAIALPVKPLHKMVFAIREKYCRKMGVTGESSLFHKVFVVFGIQAFLMAVVYQIFFISSLLFGRFITNMGGNYDNSNDLINLLVSFAFVRLLISSFSAILAAFMATVRIALFLMAPVTFYRSVQLLVSMIYEHSGQEVPRACSLEYLMVYCISLCIVLFEFFYVEGVTFVKIAEEMNLFGNCLLNTMPPVVCFLPAVLLKDLSYIEYVMAAVILTYLAIAAWNGYVNTLAIHYMLRKEYDEIRFRFLNLDEQEEYHPSLPERLDIFWPTISSRSIAGSATSFIMKMFQTLRASFIEMQSLYREAKKEA
ncbi:hypothetical protein QR680_011195 [Steinernema hermaphroditum]|uniref:RING-CH-type domain-containing protein n=1 Tax=Steinernema hermaphroditum TaxID=289476 RepID=A0AA39MBW0_9BILA|nr:hypothetical protein QR680_011195 [Steinernema hermaphroditum]